MHKKYITLGILVLLIGTCTIPNVSSEQTSNNNIITVDDEPGDADFTSIKEAVNFSNPGDTIEVYSGTYPEDGIILGKENISLLGIAHELGGGNDTGKPFIQGNGIDSVIKIEASHIIVSTFTIENPETMLLTFTCGIFVQRNPSYVQNNVTITNCTITYSAHTGIYISYTRDNIRVIDNHISHCFLDGINIMSYSPISSFMITGNVITNCHDNGIYFTGDPHHNVSGNRIKNCSVGIGFGAENTSISGNDIENCRLAIRCGGIGNSITKNNFQNYSGIGCLFFRDFFYPGRNRWNNNYWDTWKGVGPKPILGLVVFTWRYIILLIPWVEFDWNPAQEPYDIPRMIN